MRYFLALLMIFLMATLLCSLYAFYAIGQPRTKCSAVGTAVVLMLTFPFYILLILGLLIWPINAVPFKKYKLLIHLVFSFIVFSVPLVALDQYLRWYFQSH